MKAKSILTTLLALGLLLMTFEAQAGDKDRRGTAGSEHLLVPLTARTAALGTATTTGLLGMSGLEALYTNPAALSLNGGTGGLFSHMQYVADIDVNYFGVAQRFGSNNIALTLASWDFGDIPLQTEELPEPGDVTFDASFVTVGAALAREFTDRISAGVHIKYVSERIDDVSAGGVAFDAGMTYAVGESGLRFGVSLKNFGPQKSYDGTGLVKFAQVGGQNPQAQVNAVSLDGADFEMPSLLNFGVAYTREFGAGAMVTVLGNFRSNSFAQDQYAVGLELGYQNLFYVRGGYQMESDMDLTFWQGYNAGAGLNLNVAGTQLGIDYAYRAVEFFDDVQMITASVTL